MMSGLFRTILFFFFAQFWQKFCTVVPLMFCSLSFLHNFAIFLHTFCTVVPLLFCSLLFLHNFGTHFVQLYPSCFVLSFFAQFWQQFCTVVSLLFSLLLSRQPSGKRMLPPGGWKTHDGDVDAETYVTMILMMTTKLLVAGITRSFQTSFWKLWKKRNLWGRRGHWVHFSLKWNASVERDKILSHKGHMGSS